MLPGVAALDDAVMSPTSPRSARPDKVARASGVASSLDVRVRA